VLYKAFTYLLTYLLTYYTQKTHQPINNYEHNSLACHITNSVRKQKVFNARNTQLQRSSDRVQRLQLQSRASHLVLSTAEELKHLTGLILQLQHNRIGWLQINRPNRTANQQHTQLHITTTV